MKYLWWTVMKVIQKMSYNVLQYGKNDVVRLLPKSPTFPWLKNAKDDHLVQTLWNRKEMASTSRRRFRGSSCFHWNALFFFFWDGDIFKSPPLIYLTLEVLCVDYIKCLPLNLQLLTWLQYYTFKDEATFNKHILWPFRLLQGLTKVTPFNLVRAFWLRDLFLFPRTYWRALLKSLLLCLVRKGIKCFFPPSTTVGDKS